MTTPDMLSINNVAAKLGLSVHQLRRWELMFGLEIKRGRGQQRQYRDEDLSVLERIKELVEQGWPTSQIRPQLEAEGLVTPKLIGVTPNPGNPEVIQESLIGLRNFTERRFIEISKQIDELRQLLISVTLKQELATDKDSPWQATASEFVPAPKIQPAQEITIGPQISIDPPGSNMGSYGGPGLMGGRPQAGPNIPRNPERPTSNERTSFEPTSSSTSNSATGSTTSASGGTTSSANNEAVNRSMSALDSMFKGEQGRSESQPPYQKTPIIPPPNHAANDSSTASTSASASTASASTSATSNSGAGSASQPVRHSTIPPLADSASLSSSSSSTLPPLNDPAATGEPDSLAALSASESLNTSTDSGESQSSNAYAATSVDHQAVTENILAAQAEANKNASASGSDSDSGSVSAGADSRFSIPPLPPNPFKPKESESDAAKIEPPKADLRALFSKSMLEEPSSFAPGAAASAPESSESLSNAQNQPYTQSQEVTSGDLEVDVEETGQTADEDADTVAPGTVALTGEAEPQTQQPIALTPGPQVNFGPNVSAPTPQATPQRVDDNFGLGEVTDQNYLTVLGRALDLIGWTDEQADSYSLKTFGVPHWDELGRSQAEKLVAHLIGLLKEQLA